MPESTWDGGTRDNELIFKKMGHFLSFSSDLEETQHEQKFLKCQGFK